MRADRPFPSLGEIDQPVSARPLNEARHLQGGGMPRAIEGHRIALLEFENAWEKGSRILRRYLSRGSNISMSAFKLLKFG